MKKEQKPSEWLEQNKIAKAIVYAFIVGPLVGLMLWIAAIIGAFIVAAILFVIGAILCLTIIGILLGLVVIVGAGGMVLFAQFIVSHWLFFILLGMPIGLVSGIMKESTQQIKTYTGKIILHQK